MVTSLTSYRVVSQESKHPVHTGYKDLFPITQSLQALNSFTDPLARFPSTWLLIPVEFLRVLGSQSGGSVWQHTLVG